MADFEPPSFSLGLDCDLFDSDPQIAPLTQNIHPLSSNQFKDDQFKTLVVYDSEPEYPNPYPKLTRLRRGLTIGATSSSPVSADAKAVIYDEDIDVFSSPEDRLTDESLHTQHHVIERKQYLSNDGESVSVSSKCNGSESNSNLGKYDLSEHVKRKQNVSNTCEDFPKAYHYFFHDDVRIQELVRSRLPNFSPLSNMLNVDHEQPGRSKIDYMGQFSFDKSSKQDARTSRRISRKSKSEEMSQGWVNPKLGVDKVNTKRAVKRKVRAARQTPGHWLTGLDGKKVYVGKSGQELTGRVAYMQYKKESGSGFRKVKRKSVTKKKK